MSLQVEKLTTAPCLIDDKIRRFPQAGSIQVSKPMSMDYGVATITAGATCWTAANVVRLLRKRFAHIAIKLLKSELRFSYVGRLALSHLSSMTPERLSHEKYLNLFSESRN